MKLTIQVQNDTKTILFQTFVVIALTLVSMALAMPYPFALPDDAYHPAIGRVKIQVSLTRVCSG